MKNCIFFFVLFLLPIFLFGNNSNETHYRDNEFTFSKYNLKKRDTLPSFIGLTYIPALNWSVNNITNNDGKFLHYHFDQNSQTAIEGNTSIRKIGVRLGLSAQIGNNQIDRIYQYSGYIGIKNIWLYFQSSKVSGTYDWTGPIPFGFFAKRNFNSKFLTIDLRKTMKPPSKSIHDYYMGWYWGIGYTSMGLPLKMTTLTTPGGRENQIFGKPAYDSLFTARIYSICFGWDLLRQNCLTMGNQGFTPETKPKKFAMYAATQDN